MEGTVRILKRFISATMIISLFLLVFNFALLGVWIFKGMNEENSPASVVQHVAEGLDLSNESYSLDTTPANLLEQNNAWAMLIDNNGQVNWEYQLPSELPKSYSLTEVAKFSQRYLMDYPVFIWEHSEGIVVVGYPKESLAKYQYILPVDWVASFPLRLAILLLINISLVLLLSLFIGYKLIRSIRPLTQGIQALGDDKEVFIEQKGILADLAQSINRVATLLHKKNVSLKKRDEARSNWIAGISHDIRTPLSMVLGYASDLERNNEIPDEQRRQASIIRRQAENLRSLVNDLNLVSMLEYEMQPLNKRPIRLSALARKVVSDFLNNGLEEYFTIEIGNLDERIQIDGDERLLTRAISNLIQNSMKHNPDGCSIIIHTALSESNQTCSFTVEDNGKGIPQDEIPNLLELPYSSKRNRSNYNGHGLGLPMVARIAKAHHGKLILTGDVGKGLRAELILPLMPSIHLNSIK